MNLVHFPLTWKRLCSSWETMPKAESHASHSADTHGRSNKAKKDRTVTG